MIFNQSHTIIAMYHFFNLDKVRHSCPISEYLVSLSIAKLANNGNDKSAKVIQIDKSKLTIRVECA